MLIAGPPRTFRGGFFFPPFSFRTMALTRAQQTVLDAIDRTRPVLISELKSKYGVAVNQVLLYLSQNGYVALHLHDFPMTMTPAQKRGALQVGKNYYHAVHRLK